MLNVDFCIERSVVLVLLVFFFIGLLYFFHWAILEDFVNAYWLGSLVTLV